MLHLNTVLRYHTFPRVVLSWDNIFIPYDFLGWIQRHLVQLLNLRNSTLMTRYLKETGLERKLEASFFNQNNLWRNSTQSMEWEVSCLWVIVPLKKRFFFFLFSCSPQIKEERGTDCDGLWNQTDLSSTPSTSTYGLCESWASYFNLPDFSFLFSKAD